MGKLDGKVALVTGAASGIGRACVTRFCDDGARVVGRRPRRAACDVDVPTDDVVSFAQLDVRDEAAVAGAVDARGRGATAGSTRWSPPPASPAAGPRTSLDRDEWQRVLDVNLTGTFLTCKHAIARMLEQEPVDGERGSIVTIASVEGLEGTAGGSSYNASKGAVVILTKNLAIDYGRTRHPRQRDLPRVHRDADARRRVRHAGHGRRPRRTSATSTSCAGSAARRRSPRSPRSSCRATRRS